ncbi:MAG: MBOAT family O-acyltransferase [Candidatus Korobacteraceae bacterium]
MLLTGLLYGVALLIALLAVGKLRSHKVRQCVLLLASYALYLTWGVWFGAVLLASTVMNFLVGRWLKRQPPVAVLWAGLAFNLALLAVFKYIPGIAVSIPVASLQKFSHLALPLGISFWTFQAMSYLLDLYRGEELDPSFVEFALYMAFFPVTISGPICRMPEMLPQFRSEERVSRHDIGLGLCRIATGVLMMQAAQLLGKGILGGEGINGGFDHLTRWSGLDVWCLAFGYGLQLFFDFAGYSHVAIGAAQVLGFTVPENFARPFASTTPSIFWTRWHMSLSFWIRDYVFLPLAVLRREMWWRNLALVISMVLFGLWHKGSILFVLWGSYQGILLVLHRQLQALQRRLKWEPPAAIWTPISWVVTITLIIAGWTLFRANSLPQATQMLAAVASPASYVDHVLPRSLYLLVVGLALAYAAVLFAVNWLNRWGTDPAMSRSEIVQVMVRERWVWIAPMWAAASLLVVTMMERQSGGANVFMYRLF